jgi:hypothetical protein
MHEYDATELAFRNGEERGYRRSFADGIHASAIAPIQWRDAKKYPFQPEAGKEYFVITEGAKRWYWYRYDPGEPPEFVEHVRFWVPMELPIELGMNAEDPEDGRADD